MLLTIRPVAGSIVGSVQARGAKVPGAGGIGSSDKYESRRQKFLQLQKIDYARIQEFVVFIDQSIEAPPEPPTKPVQVVTQKDGRFRPHVLPVQVGTVVEWPNRDDILHNVFSYSDAKPFDLGLYRDKPGGKSELKRVLFDKAGRVDVFCSIHSQMHCILLVLEHPYFAATDARGRFKIADVPAGTYRVKAWHERMPPKVVTVTVPETGEVRIDFVLGLDELPKY